MAQLYHLKPTGISEEKKGRAQSLRGAGGDGTFGEMDPWQQSIDTRLGDAEKKIDKNLLWVLAAFAAGFVLLGTLILNRTDAVQTSITGLGNQISAVAQDVAVLKARHP